MFVKRDSLGQIITISLEQTPDCNEPIDDSDPMLVNFVQNNRTTALQQYELKETDLPLIRVIEDLVDLLSETGVIRFTDLPQEAQSKLLKRKSMRRRSSSLNLLDYDNDVI
ncbi:MAG: tryptophan synthase subunit beta like protein [Gammaproteobacteria bacterium HGW-Gammaproteobacteria-11]|nr:MAG: tryptophan synthase subunit beta like protein [Gammaproteobacteria bacterium HGW-Gammaproteobacteria-11]